MKKAKTNPFRKSAAKAPAKMRVRKNTKVASKTEEKLFDGSGNFNPSRYSRKKAASERVFDANGEVNAYDKKDALVQIASILDSAKKNANSLSMTRTAEATEEEKRQVLAAALQDPSERGFRRIGQELSLPIKAILDYEGFSRKIYRVRKLGQAELFRVPKDIRSVAYIIGQDGMTPEARIKTKWVTPEEYKITSFPVVDIDDIYQANFDILQRAQDTARQEIELQEDKAGINLLDASASAVNDVTTYSTLGIGAFEDVRYQVEKHRLLVENFLIARSEVSDIVKTMSSGYIGNILNAQILTTAGTGVEEVIPSGTFYATTGPDYLGEMGERIELFSEPFNKYANGETVKGWAFIEKVGFVIPNARACAKGVK